MDSDLEATPVNLGNPDEHTIEDMAKRVIELTGSTSTLTYKDLPKDDPVRRKPDISKAKAQLGWSPKVPLEAGLKGTIEDFRSRMS